MTTRALVDWPLRVGSALLSDNPKLKLPVDWESTKISLNLAAIPDYFTLRDIHRIGSDT
jgi:hypothetical protein